jgi:hypothetical protein
MTVRGTMPKSITERIVECRTPEGRTFRVERSCYDAVRNALLEILPERGAYIEMFELNKRVAEQLDVTTLRNVESLSWLVAWVRLDLENEGLLLRDPAVVTRVQ